jgi:hypothetical protein
MGTIDYGAEGGSLFAAPVMRIDDDGHGFVGVVCDAATRQSIDFDSGKPKWFVNKRLVLADEKPAGGQPVNDFIFHIAVEKGKGAFTKRDDDGEPVKLSSGKNALEVRSIEREDVAVVFSAAWMARAAKSVKLNTGHKVRFVRRTAARDENGDRMTDVQCEIAVLDTVSDPQPYDQARSTVSYEDEGDPFGGASDNGAAGEPQPAGVGAGAAASNLDDPF